MKKVYNIRTPESRLNWTETTWKYFHPKPEAEKHKTIIFVVLSGDFSMSCRRKTKKLTTFYFVYVKTKFLRFFYNLNFNRVMCRYRFYTQKLFSYSFTDPINKKYVSFKWFIIAHKVKLFSTMINEREIVQYFSSCNIKWFVINFSSFRMG